jgi:hypothetical protein
MELWDRLGSNDSEKEPTKKEAGRHRDRRKRLWVACMPALQEHRPPPEEENVTTGVGCSGRAALRREQCDVHAVGQQSQQRKDVE